MAIKWGWPFPKAGEGSFLGGQLFGKNPGGEFRPNGFHNGLDFGSIDHPGNEFCAVHAGKVVFAGWAPSGYEALGTVIVTKSDDGYFIVYQEFGSSTGNILVKVGDSITLGQVIGTRNTSHLHLGVTKKDWLQAQSSAFSDDGTWLDPLKIIREGLKDDGDDGGQIIIEEDEILRIYWKQQKVGSTVYDAYLLNGNKRMYIHNNTLLNECRVLTRLFGDTKEERFYNDAYRVLALEATTDLVEFKYYANKYFLNEVASTSRSS